MKLLDSQRAWALLFARLVLGLIFFMAGVWKVFQLGPLEHARKYFLPFSDTFLPTWSLWAVGVVIPFVELIAGARHCARSGHIWTPIERTALSVSYACDSAPGAAAVRVDAPARGRQILTRLFDHPEAIEGESERRKR